MSGGGLMWEQLDARSWVLRGAGPFWEVAVSRPLQGDPWRRVGGIMDEVLGEEGRRPMGQWRWCVRSDAGLEVCSGAAASCEDAQVQALGALASVMTIARLAREGGRS